VRAELVLGAAADAQHQRRVAAPAELGRLGHADQVDAALQGELVDRRHQRGRQERARVQAAVDQHQVAGGGPLDRLANPGPLGQLAEHVDHPAEVGQLALADHPGGRERLGVAALGVGLGQRLDGERGRVLADGDAVAVPDGAGPIDDHPERAPVDQAGRAAVDGRGGDAPGRVDRELGEAAVLGEVEGAAVLGGDRFVDRVVDAGALVGQQAGEVLGAAPDAVGVVLDEQPRSPLGPVEVWRGDGDPARALQARSSPAGV
jgi:hypothetical protein